MLKKCLFYSIIIATIGFMSSGFKPSKNESKNVFTNDEKANSECSFPSKNNLNYTSKTIPYVGKFFIGFKEAIAFKESQGNYKLVNTLGYMGKYQFGMETLKTIGIHDSTAFLNNKKLQEKAFIALLKINKSVLKKEIEQYSGKTIAGVKVTESGILASAHLGGAGSVKKFLKSNGKQKCKDAYGSSVKSYMKKFGGYETSGIVAKSNAKAK
jgi:hypothetical protein